jgi:hypothetical protein
MDPTLIQPGALMVPMMDATSVGMDYRFQPTAQEQVLAFAASVQSEPTTFQITVGRENAWSAWAAGAKVCEMRIFLAGACGRVSVPPLPRSLPARRVDLPPFRCATRSIREPFARPISRQVPPRLVPPRVRKNLESILELPIAIIGEDLLKLSKALNMRFTFQLVKATGENIRNLDVLGVYRVPVKGVAALRHDPKTGRILVNLNQEAVGADRGRFILARKKDDRSFVSCFVEE